jgi:hypothetical protein
VIGLIPDDGSSKITEDIDEGIAVLEDTGLFDKNLSYDTEYEGSSCFELLVMLAVEFCMPDLSEYRSEVRDGIFCMTSLLTFV